MKYNISKLIIAISILLFSNPLFAIVYRLGSDDYIIDVPSVTVMYALGFTEMDGASTPAANKGYLFIKPDGKMYYKNDAGTEYDLTQGGAGTSPGGADTQIQYNNAGSFGGIAGFTYDGSSITATIQLILDSIKWGDGTIQVSSPTAGGGGITDHTGLTSTGTLTHAQLETAITNLETSTGTLATSITNLETSTSTLDGYIASLWTSTQTLETATALNTTHRTSNGTDHTYIDQDVTSGSSPNFSNASMSGNISVWTNDSGYLTWSDTGTGNNEVAAGTHTHAGVYQPADDDLTDLADGTLSKSKVEDSGNWDTAYGWGDHSAQNYLDDDVADDVDDGDIDFATDNTAGKVNLHDFVSGAPGSGEYIQWNGSNWVTSAVSGGGTSSLWVGVDDVEKSSPTMAISFQNQFQGDKIGTTTYIRLSTATPSNGDTTHISNCDQIYDFVNGNYEPMVTEGSLADNTVTGDDLKDDLVFGTFPVTPSAAPDADYEVANKKYVDDNAGGGGNYVTSDSSDTMAASISGTDSLFTIHNTTGDVTGTMYLLDLKYTDNNDANAAYIKCSDDADGTPKTMFSINYQGKVYASDDIQCDAVLVDSENGNAEFGWTSSGNDHAYIAVDTNGVTKSGNLYFLQIDNKQNTYGHPTTIDPKFFIMSGRGATDSTTDYMCLYHDRTDARIDVGTGCDLKINTNIESTGTVTGATANFAGAVTITEGALTDSMIVSADIKNDTIDSDDYAAGSIDAEHLAADVIDESKIADNGIDSEHYNDGSIDAVHLAADVIDETKLADNSIDSEHYNDGSIDYEHLSAGVIDYVFEQLCSTFTVCISTPNNLTAGVAYGPIDDVWEFATTITTMTMTVNGGTITGMVEQRSMDTPDSAGTDVWSGDVTADTTWRGGTFNDATVPSMYGLFYIPTSGTGNVGTLKIKGARTKD